MRLSLQNKYYQPHANLFPFSKNHIAIRHNLYSILPQVGYSSSHNALHAEAARTGDQTGLRAKRSWDLALGPIKQVPMNLFVMYMSGNTISIFPIMMVIMMAVRPFKTLFSVGATFKALDSSNAGADGQVEKKR